MHAILYLIDPVPIGGSMAEPVDKVVSVFTDIIIHNKYI